MVRGGSSYCSQSELTLTFGLGRDARADLEVEWPSGVRQRFPGVAAGQTVTVEEGQARLRP
jgi:hypothetical protein